MFSYVHLVHGLVDKSFGCCDLINVNWCLIVKVMNLSQTPSRTLISSIKTLFGAYPQATIDGVLLPSLTMSTAGGCPFNKPFNTVNFINNGRDI